jgi:2-phospho-L-lactate guanylyltransferase
VTSTPPLVTAIVPVKPLGLAKSRLTLPTGPRRDLALAFALDTISALKSSPVVAAVLVVTSDPVVAEHVRRLRVRLVRDDAGGLDHAVREGARVARSRRPDAGVAVVPADLPCLRATDVTDVLGQAASDHGAFVPDRAGTGTTLVVHPPGSQAVTRYGPGSAARHAALGLEQLRGAPVRARHDVDTVEDLEVAATLGLGPRTAGVVAEPDVRWLRTSVPRPSVTRPRGQPIR